MIQWSNVSQSSLKIFFSEFLIPENKLNFARITRPILFSNESLPYIIVSFINFFLKPKPIWQKFNLIIFLEHPHSPLLYFSTFLIIHVKSLISFQNEWVGKIIPLFSKKFFATFFCLILRYHSLIFLLIHLIYKKLNCIVFFVKSSIEFNFLIAKLGAIFPDKYQGLISVL